MKEAILIAACYLLGSVPFGLIAGRLRGVDLREVGSKNIGATNALRSLGKGPALFTLLGDLLKGSLAVSLGLLFGLDPIFQGALGLSAVFGHVFPVFLRFKGGKGVATGFGVLMIYMPTVAVITLLIWLLIAAVTRYSSLAAVVCFGLLPLSSGIFDYSREKETVAIALSILIIFRHLGNIKRLLNETETKIGEKTA